MSNQVMNAHIMLGEPCGDDADFFTIADWAGELIMSGNGRLTKHQLGFLRSIAEFLHTEQPEPGQREWAIEEYYRLYDSVTGRS